MINKKFKNFTKIIPLQKSIEKVQWNIVLLIIFSMKFVFELMIRKLEILLENYVGIRFPPIKSFNFLQFLVKCKILDIYLILYD